MNSITNVGEPKAEDFEIPTIEKEGGLKLEVQTEKRTHEVAVAFFFRVREGGLERYIVLETFRKYTGSRVVEHEDLDDELDPSKYDVSLVRQSFEVADEEALDSIKEAQNLVQTRMLKTEGENSALVIKGKHLPITYTAGEEFSSPNSKSICPVYAVVDLTAVRSSLGQDRVVHDLFDLVFKSCMKPFRVSDEIIEKAQAVSLSDLAPGFGVRGSGIERVVTNALHHIQIALPKLSRFNLWRQGVQLALEWRHQVVIGPTPPRPLWKDITGWTYDWVAGLGNRVVDWRNQVVHYVSRSNNYVYNMREEMHQHQE